MKREGGETCPLHEYLARIPSVEILSHGDEEGGRWWVKLSIDIDHRLAWHVVQELGHVLNYISIEERLPTVFKPVSPPPYMNGGPREFLSWVIESEVSGVDRAWVAETLEGRLPRPVEDEREWVEGPSDDSE